MDNNSINSEELLYSLPDYIKGKIDNKELISAIENKLLTDKDFKNQYENILSTVSFMNESKLPEPPEHYFTNFVPILNQRIDGLNRKPKSFYSIPSLLKYAIPILTIFLIAIIFLLNQNTSEIKFPDTNKTNITSRNIEPNTTDNDFTDESVKTNTSEELSNTEEINKISKIKYSLNKNTKNNIEENTNISAISDFISDIAEPSSEETDDYYYESDFHELTNSEQNEIINNLAKNNF